MKIRCIDKKKGNVKVTKKLFEAYCNKNIFRGNFLNFFPKIKWKFKRKHVGKYNGIKAPGKFKLVKNSH